MLFERCHTNNRKRSLRQHVKYFNLRSKILLDHPVHIYITWVIHLDSSLQALSAVQIVLAITFCCQSGKASHCFFAFFVLEEVVLYLTLGVAGLFKLSSGRPSGADAISGGGAGNNFKALIYRLGCENVFAHVAPIFWQVYLAQHQKSAISRMMTPSSKVTHYVVQAISVTVRLQ